MHPGVEVFYPALALVLLTLIVALRMYKDRVGWFIKNRVSPQKASIRSERDWPAEIQKSSDNFQNLLELPILFYFATVVLYVTQTVDTIALVLAWLYVAHRYVHSFIHCTYNKVIQRFYVYAVSGLILFALWGKIGFDLLTA